MSKSWYTYKDDFNNVRFSLEKITSVEVEEVGNIIGYCVVIRIGVDVIASVSLHKENYDSDDELEGLREKANKIADEIADQATNSLTYEQFCRLFPRFQTLPETEK